MRSLGLALLLMSVVSFAGCDKSSDKPSEQPAPREEGEGKESKTSADGNSGASVSADNSSAEDTSQEENTSKAADDETPSQEDWMEVTIDGVRHVTPDDRRFIYVRNAGVPGYDLYQIVGSYNKTLKSAVTIYLENFTGTGEVDLSDRNGSHLEWVIFGKVNLKNEPGKGTLTITLNDKDRIEGTFAFDGVADGFETVTITKGRFSIGKRF